MDHARGVIRAGHDRGADRGPVGPASSTARARAGRGLVELALGFSLVWAGPGIQTFTATANRPVLEGEPTLFEIWVCADGYWCDHTKNLVVGELTERYRELEAGLREVYDDAVALLPSRARASPSSTGSVREGVERLGFRGQPTHPICHGVGARAHEPPYAHQAGGGEVQRPAWSLQSSQDATGTGEAASALEDNWLITDDAPEKLSRVPRRHR